MNSENWKPGLLQEHLLKSALLKGDQALHHWNKWKKSVNLDLIERSSHRLLSIVYSNIKDIAAGDPLMERLKGIYKKTWFKNQILFHQLESILKLLHENNISNMLLKGSALTLLYYKDYGLRSMEDLDILIHIKDAEKALSLLKAEGWISKKKHHHPLNEKYLPFLDGIHLTGRNGCECDLQWDLMRMNLAPDDSLFWEHAIDAEINNTKASTLSAEDHLLHTCEHALSWRQSPNIRWIADAGIIIHSKEKPVNWDRFTEQVHYNHLTPFVTEMLQYLKHTYHIHIPGSVVDQLRNKKITDFEEKYYRRILNSYRQRNRFKGCSRRYYAVYWSVYRQFFRAKPEKRRFPASWIFLMRSLQVKQNIKYLWLMPAAMVVLLFKRIYLTFTGKDTF